MAADAEDVEWDLAKEGDEDVNGTVAAVIATSGDESFIMLSMIPEKVSEEKDCGHEFALHAEDTCRCLP